MFSTIKCLILLTLVFNTIGLLYATEYVVRVRTGSSFGAGTDANVYIRLVGTKGVTAEHKLTSSSDPFERNSVDTFTINDVIDVGDMTSVSIKRDKIGWFDDWKLDKIAVFSKSTGEWSMFVYGKWLSPNTWTTILVTCETDQKRNPSTGACKAFCGKKPNSPRPDVESKVSHQYWPWLGIVEFNSGSRICSASLIASKWVMTTAWCVYGKKATQLRVRFGVDNANLRSPTEQVIDVQYAFLHPSYHRVTLMSHDLALLKLLHPVTMGNDAEPACLPKHTTPSPVNVPNKKCWFPLWERGKGDLRQVPISLFNLSVCMKLDRPLPIAHPSMLCGTLGRQATGPCTSDPGGPLVCESQGKWFLEGLISTGTDCYVDGPKARFFTNIRYLKQWADKIMEENPGI